MHYNTKKLKPGLVASYDIWPGNGEGLFWFQCFINLSLTDLLSHLHTYSQHWDPHGAKKTRKSLHVKDDNTANNSNAQ